VDGCVIAGCGPGLVCNPDTNRCGSTPCVVDGDCIINFFCLPQGVCGRKGCADSDDCGDGFCVGLNCYSTAGTCAPLPI
jgi:hypothetical protein